MKAEHGEPKAILVMLLLAIIGAGLAGCTTEEAAGAASVMSSAAPPPGEVWVTAHTTRLPGRDPIETAVRISEVIFAATRDEDRPDAVLLARVDRPAHAILAVNRLIHFPTNAPLLYVEENEIPPATREELRRLRPEGNFADGNVQVYAVGDVGEGVIDELREMGLKTRHFRESDPFLLGEAMDSWSGAVHGDHPNEVVVVPIDSLTWALPFSAWNAHKGQGFFFVTRDSVPAPTARALTRRFRGPWIFLVGNPEMASARLADQLAALGYVERFDQRDAYGLSAFFAGYNESGRNWGWWFGETPRNFGWGIQDDGNNYTFVNPADLMSAIPASILSHMGKHGPMLLIEGDRIPQPVASYLEKVRPGPARPSVQQLNRAWIIGDGRRISHAIQAEVDDWMSVKQPGLPVVAPPEPETETPTPPAPGPTPTIPPDTSIARPDTIIAVPDTTTRRKP